MGATVSYWTYATFQLITPEPETGVCLQVDMTWSGHVHVYERTCPILFHECLGYTAAGIPNAPVHMAIGNGGVSPYQVHVELSSLGSSPTISHEIGFFA